MSGGLESYKFGQKNNWRRWAWNRIARTLLRSGVHPSEAIGIYLPGKQDLDRDVALSKGFLPDNLIPVDMDRSTIESLRKAGRLAIHSKALPVLSSWNCKRVPLNFIHADPFHCASSLSTNLMQQSLAVLGASGGGVLSMTVSRGHENGPYGELIRETRDKGVANRFVLVLMGMIADWAADEAIKRKDPNAVAPYFESRLKFWTNRIVGMRTYRSKTSTMDCGILSVPNTFVKNAVPATSEKSREIAAFLAHRTMRLRA